MASNVKYRHDNIKSLGKQHDSDASLEKKRLVFIILGKLSILENEENQSTVNLIRGLLRELLNCN